MGILDLEDKLKNFFTRAAEPLVRIIPPANLLRQLQQSRGESFDIRKQAPQIPNVVREVPKQLFRSHIKAPNTGQFFPSRVQHSYNPTRDLWPIRDRSKMKEFGTQFGYGIVGFGPKAIRGMTPQIARSILKVSKGATVNQVKIATGKMLKQKFPNRIKDLASKYKVKEADLIYKSSQTLFDEAFSKTGKAIVPKSTLPKGTQPISQILTTKKLPEPVRMDKVAKAKYFNDLYNYTDETFLPRMNQKGWTNDMMLDIADRVKYIQKENPNYKIRDLEGFTVGVLRKSRYAPLENKSVGLPVKMDFYEPPPIEIKMMDAAAKATEADIAATKVEPVSMIEPVDLKTEAIAPIEKAPIIQPEAVKIEPEIAAGAETISSKLRNVREGRVSFENQVEYDSAIAIDKSAFKTKYNELETGLARLDKDMDKEDAVKLLTGQTKLADVANQRVATLFQRWIADMAIFEQLGKVGKIRKKYWPSISNEQIGDPVLDELFPKSRMTQAILDLPQLEVKTKPSYIGDASLVDTFNFRSDAAVAHAYKNAEVLEGEKAIDLTSKENIMDQIQEGVPKEKIEDFSGKIGMFQTKKTVKAFEDLTKAHAQFVGGAYVGGITDMGLKPLFTPIYMGRANNIKWRTEMYQKLQDPEYMKNAWNFIDDVAKELGFKKDSDKYNELVGTIIERRKVYGSTERSNKYIIDKVGQEVHIDKPAKKLEKWTETHNITDETSKKFFDDTVKEIYVKEQKEYSEVMETLNVARRIQYLGTIGMKASTIMFQPLETVRAVARYPKHVWMAYARSFQPSKYEHFKENDQIRKYIRGTKVLEGGEINYGTYRKILNILDAGLEKGEKAGYYGIQAAESWKDNVFLEAARLKGKADGLTGKDLDTFVFEEFKEFGHKYGKEDIGKLGKNPFFKMAFMFQTYGIKNINHILRSIDRLVTTPQKKTEALYLALYALGSYGVYRLYKDVFKTDRSYLQSAAMEVPEPYNPLFNYLSLSYQYAQLSDEEKEQYTGMRMKSKLDDSRWRNVPYMNQAVNVTGKTIGNIKRGYAETFTGNVAYPAPKKPLDIIKALTLSPYAYDAPQKYFAGEISSLGSKQSEMFKIKGDQYYYDKQAERKIKTDANKLFKKREAGEAEIGTDDFEVLTEALGIREYFKPTTGTGIKAFDFENEKYGVARDVYGEEKENYDLLDESEKEEIYKRLGFKEEDIAYDYEANQTSVVKAEYLNVLLKGKKQSEIENALIMLRRESHSGKVYSNNATLDNLAQLGLITEDQADIIKKYKWDGSKVSSGGRLKAKKPPKVTIKKLSVPKYTSKKITLSKPRKINLTSPPKIKVTVPKTTSIKMSYGSVPIIKVPELPKVKVVNY